MDRHREPWLFGAAVGTSVALWTGGCASLVGIGDIVGVEDGGDGDGGASRPIDAADATTASAVDSGGRAGSSYDSSTEQQGDGSGSSGLGPPVDAGSDADATSPVSVVAENDAMGESGHDAVAESGIATDAAPMDATVDPCAIGNGGCASEATCSDRPNGGALCTCNFGWTGDGTACVNDGPTCPGPAGSCVTFVPTGGVEQADLDGEGLLPFVVVNSNAADGGDGGSAGDAAVVAGEVDTNPEDTVIDVDTGLITNNGIVLRPATTGNTAVRDVQAGIAYRQTADNLAIFTFRSLTVTAGTNLKLLGLRPAILASATTMQIDGVIDIRPMTSDGTACSFNATAPGGYAGGNGGFNSEEGTMPSTAGQAPQGFIGGGASQSAGGGGGGHAAAGATGCSDDGGGDCAPGGSSYDIASLDVPADFHGGAGGGGGGFNAPQRVNPSEIFGGGNGGAGGGALRMVAADSITVGDGPSYGGVNAGGCGGMAGGTCGPFCGPSPIYTGSGGGGGAGGAVVVEAPRIELGAFGSVVVGGGSGGDEANNGASPTITAAAPGCYGGTQGGAPFLNSTGAGGAVSPVPVSGEADCAGGGAGGWIRFNAGGGNVAIASGALLLPAEGSPAVSIGVLVESDGGP